jgi:hypothetical protein
MNQSTSDLYKEMEDEIEEFYSESNNKPKDLKFFIDFDSDAGYDKQKIFLGDPKKKARLIVEKRPKLIDIRKFKNKGKTGQLF